MRSLSLRPITKAMPDRLRPDRPTYQQTEKQELPLTVAIDFDGTIIPEEFRHDLEHAQPRPGAIEAIKKFWSAGWLVIIWTSKSCISNVTAWLEKHGIPFDSVNTNPEDTTGSRKMIADVYIDDRAVNALSDWPEISKQAEKIMAHRRKSVSLAHNGKDQPFEDYPEARKQARDRLASFRAKLKTVAGGFTVKACVKTKDSFETKRERGFDPDEITDVLRGAVITPSKDEVESVVESLKGVFDVRKIDRKVNPDDGLGYHGAVHVDVDIDGMAVEIQVMPKSVWDVKQETEPLYDRLRVGEDVPREELTEARRMFHEANKALTDVKERLQKAGEILKTHEDPAPMPGYGKIFVNDSDIGGREAEVWYVGGDGDEDGFSKVVEKVIREAFPAVSKIHYEAEGFPPKNEGWRQIYPSERSWTKALDSHGGIVPESLQRAQKVDLITLPDGVNGTNCKNCSFIDTDLSPFRCTHPEIQMPVTSRNCCALWTADGTIRAWEQSKALIGPDSNICKTQDRQVPCNGPVDGGERHWAEVIQQAGNVIPQLDLRPLKKSTWNYQIKDATGTGSTGPQGGQPGFTGKRKEGNRTICRQNGQMVPCKTEVSGTGQATQQTQLAGEDESQREANEQTQPTDYSDPQFAAEWAAEVEKHLPEIEQNDVSAHEFSAQEAAAEGDWHKEYIKWRWGLSFGDEDTPSNKGKFSLRPADMGPAARFISGLLNRAVGGPEKASQLKAESENAQQQTGQQGSSDMADIAKGLVGFLNALAPALSNKPAADLIASLFGQQAIPIVEAMAGGQKQPMKVEGQTAEPALAKPDEGLTDDQLASMTPEERREAIKQERAEREPPSTELQEGAGSTTRGANPQAKRGRTERVERLAEKGRKKGRAIQKIREEARSKALSAMNETSGGALVPPPAWGGPKPKRKRIKSVAFGTLGMKGLLTISEIRRQSGATFRFDLRSPSGETIRVKIEPTTSSYNSAVGGFIGSRDEAIEELGRLVGRGWRQTDASRNETPRESGMQGRWTGD